MDGGFFVALVGWDAVERALFIEVGDDGFVVVVKVFGGFDVGEVAGDEWVCFDGGGLAADAGFVLAEVGLAWVWDEAVHGVWWFGSD